MADMEGGGAVSPSAVAKGLIKFNPGYLTSPPGILKLLEFVSMKWRAYKTNKLI